MLNARAMSAAAAPSEETAELTLAVAPDGLPRFIPAPAGQSDDGQPPLARAVASRVQKAFEAGPGAGVLHLGAVEVQAQLPPGLAYFRELGHSYMTGLCALPDLEGQRTSFTVPVPEEQLQAMAHAAPPILGAEYVSVDALRALWEQLEEACRAQLREYPGTAAEYLHSKHEVWNLVGRVYLHLAENKASEETPFAFLATYTTHVSKKAKVQHVPLAQALTEYEGQPKKLLSLFEPLQRASQQSALVKQLLDSKELFQPQAWTPDEAYAFLKELPVLESSGVIVRVPDWWKAKRPPRPQVTVSVGQSAKSRLGTDALLDFKVGLTVEGQALTEAEWKKLAASSASLVFVKGKWVEVDQAKLQEVLAHWKKVEQATANGELSFAEGMRLLSGVALGDETVPEVEHEWSKVVAGPWLAKLLEDLRRPEAKKLSELSPKMATALRPYQRAGVEWLSLVTGLGLGGLLADDMGLGKSLQTLALLARHTRRGGLRPSLLVAPASLLANWQAELARWAPELTFLVAHPSAMPTPELQALPASEVEQKDLIITTYGTLSRVGWLLERPWGLAVIDEAQAIKNPSSQQSRAVRKLKAKARVALTGTPVENRLGDLWSLFDFLNPGLLGSAKQFSQFTKKLAKRPENPYGPLRELVQPYLLRRMKTDKSIIADLPEKTELSAYCSLSATQAKLYEEAVASLRLELADKEGQQRRGLVLAYLMRFKQICNHPSQWLGDGEYAPGASGKFARLRELCEEIAARQEKVLVFTQFREMTDPLAAFLAQVFGRPGLVLHGETKVKERGELVKRFEQGPAPFFVLSLKAGGTGLNLTAASHVIHFDRWWNPAVEDQATDRAFRIGQKRNVLVHKFVCKGTLEEKIDALIRDKRGISQELLQGGGEIALTELPDSELLRLVSLDLSARQEE